MFKKLFQKKKTVPPGKDQPDIFLGSADLKDLISPAAIKEPDPGKSGDYYVEVGATAEFTRFFRNFFAVLTTSSTYAGMLDSLYAGDFGEADCDVALHITSVDPSRTSWQLEQKIAQLEADHGDESNSAKRSVIGRQIADLQRRHSAICQGTEKIFMASVQVMASAVDKKVLKRFSSMLVKKFASKGIHLRAADTRQLQAMFGMTPLDKNIIKDTFRDMESSNIADLFPFGLGGLRHKSGIVIGRDPQGTLLFYDCWEPSLGNYNITIFGRAGFGKSFLVKMMTLRSSFIGITTAIIDPEYEYENLMAAMGCPYIKLAPGSEYSINIFDLDEEEDEHGNVSVNIEDGIQAAQAVVFKMIRTFDPEVLTGNVKVQIQEHIKDLYVERGITEDPGSLYLTETADGTIPVGGVKKEMPVLSNLYDKMARNPELKEAARLLKPYTKYGGRPSQAIFDCQSSVSISGVPAFAISVKGLDEDIMRPIGLFVATKWVWEFFGKNYHRKKRIVVDEAQTMMDEDSSETAKWLENAFRRSRKRNISMCAATQGFEVFLRLPQGLGILKNSSTKFLMRQESIDIEAVKEKFSLSEGESAFLLNAPKGQGIVRANENASVFYGEVTGEEYDMFTSDPNDLVGGV
ncbi:MAG: ATP-binding protein [Clostridiales bacterium]|nr:ATP-binding protein [Clostridiales bacterium]MCF8022694.1 ATP-binding protein [Clostridiales bacterium]